MGQRNKDIMSYISIDTLQNALKDTVFLNAKDAKKAAGRALGTIVELVTYYLLREWGLCDHISIERRLPEFGDKEITHNVEFTLHPILKFSNIKEKIGQPITIAKMAKSLPEEMTEAFEQMKSNRLLDANNTLRNSCLLGESDSGLLVANAHQDGIHVAVQRKTPFAMVECKRVGVEEGCKKGPQTIEKAKQGAYVAQMTSALQKVWVDGQRYGLVYKEGSPVVKPYAELLDEVIEDDVPLQDFILSIGVVSNHGNWFTAENKNKEMKVLANSYDWLLFLTDAGLAEFVHSLLFEPKPQYAAVRAAFIASYKEGKKSNVFTKTKIDKKAHDALCEFFSSNLAKVERWFNVIAPEDNSIENIKTTLAKLASKKWEVTV